MRDKRSYDTRRKVDTKYQGQPKRQYKGALTQKKKNIYKVPVAMCFVIGIGIGWITEFDIINSIENISKYELVIVEKRGNQSEKDNYKEAELEEQSAEQVELEEEISQVNEVIEENTTKVTESEDVIKKAKKSIVEQCGQGFSDVIYTGETEFDGEKYYCFGINIDGEVGGDMAFFVDKTTYQVYESSVDGYFGEYRWK